MTDSNDDKASEYQRHIRALYAAGLARMKQEQEQKTTKIKIAISTGKNSTKLLGIDLSKISAFVYDGPSVQLWFDGAPEALNIEKSSVHPQAFSQLLGALEDEFPELYGDEFPNRCLYEDVEPRESRVEYDQGDLP